MNTTGGKYLGYSNPPRWRCEDCGTPMHDKDIAGMYYGKPICGCRMEHYRKALHADAFSYVNAARPWMSGR